MTTHFISSNPRVDEPTAAALELTIVAETAPARLVARGVVDSTTVSALRIALEQAVAAHGRILLDLSEVTSIDTEGIRVLYHHAENLLAVVVAAHSLLHQALLLASRFPVLVTPARPGEHRWSRWPGAARRPGKLPTTEGAARLPPPRLVQGRQAPPWPTVAPGQQTRPARRRQPLVV